MKKLLITLLAVSSLSSFANLNKSFKRAEVKMLKLAPVALETVDRDCVNDYFTSGLNDIFWNYTNRVEKVLNKKLHGYISAIMETSRYEIDGANFSFKVSNGSFKTSGILTSAINQNRLALENSDLLNELRSSHPEASVDQVLTIIRKGNKSRELCNAKLLDLIDLKEFVQKNL